MIIGITGRIASGKSEVLNFFKNRGFCCIDADKITHELYKKDAVGAKMIAKFFGKNFLKKSGEVDRRKLRTLVFSDFEVLSLLNEIMHPLIVEQILKELKKSKGKNIAVEAIFLENDLSKLIDKIIWIERPKKKIAETLVSERKLEEKVAQKIINLVKKPRRVDFVVKNDKSKVELVKRVSLVYSQLSL